MAQICNVDITTGTDSDLVLSGNIQKFLLKKILVLIYIKYVMNYIKYHKGDCCIGSIWSLRVQELGSIPRFRIFCDFLFFSI